MAEIADITVKVNDIVCTADGREFRVLYVNREYAVLFEMNTTKFIARTFSTDDIISFLHDKSWHIRGDEDSIIVDEAKLDPAIAKRYSMYKKLMHEVDQIYGPTYIGLSGRGTKPEMAALLEKYGLKKSAFWKQVVIYLQSGCKESSLLDKRTLKSFRSDNHVSYSKRTGRPKEYGQKSNVIIDSQVEKYFAEALKDYASGRAKTYKGCYEDMLRKHYTVTTYDNGVVTNTMKDESELPTMWQFYYYAKTNMTPEQRDAIRTSKEEVRNNKRLLLSDTMKGVHGPGDMAEIDALEADISLVSEADREHTIGRGILYLMIDVWTRVILAMSVSFENNSTLAFTNLFLNLSDDKAKYAAKFGITSFSPNLWPSNIIPRRIRVDRGADFRSDKVEAILNQIGIERLLEPAATGSLKGIVEQEFHQIQFNQNSFVENNGLIEKRHDSQHHKEAKLTIREYTQMCVNYVLNHNQKYLQYYKMNKRMRDDGVRPIPAELWKYGCRIYGMPRPIADKNTFFWALLTPANARINREGIKWKDLYYMNYTDKKLTHRMYQLQSKYEGFEARYDPRDIGQLYYISDGKLETAPLNPAKFGNQGFEGMTYKDYMEYRARKKAMDAEGRRHNLEVSVTERTVNDTIVSSVSAPRYSDPNNMRENREEEKQAVNSGNSIQKRLSDSSKEAISTSKDESSQKSENPDSIVPEISFDDALDDYKERNK